jgi:chemosensory pili system protein ChpA (sensor histidine kinase/response regulator)
MRVRMVPLTSIGARIQRTVQVAASQEGKIVDVLIEGQSIELDTTVLNQIVDPLLHLLRNSVSHGIEPPMRRRLLGKPERGTIGVNSNYDGTDVVIEISDDGAGLDPAFLRSTAVKKGYLSGAVAEATTDKEAFALIFLPGFSTASEVSEVSGRGVGMDIVKAAVNKLQGTVTVDSTPGKGTSFTIRLPTTLAVKRALMIKSNGERFAIPFGVVTQILRVGRDEIEHMAHDPVVRVEGKVFPVVRLGEALGLKQPADDTMSRLPVLIVTVGSDQFALVVDQILEGREIVIKSLGNHLRRIKGVVGATLMGDGSVVPILNPVDLVHRNGQRSIAPSSVCVPPQPPQPRGNLTIMVVDDSPSVRRVMSNLLKSAGWQPIQAKDGLDALDILNNSSQRPSLILLDVEMPRMDGYELLATLKRHETHREIPVVMITSRTGEKHRLKALELGASEYLSKPYHEDELVGTVRRLAN